MKRIDSNLWSTELFHVLSLRGTLNLLDRLGEHSRTFSVLAKDTGLDVATLMRRLRAMEALNIIDRRPTIVKKRQTEEYGLTDVGLEILKFVVKEEAHLSRLLGKKEISQTVVSFEQSRGQTKS